MEAKQYGEKFLWGEIHCKNKKMAKLIAQAPELLKQRDELLEVLKEAYNLINVLASLCDLTEKDKKNIRKQQVTILKVCNKNLI